MSFTSDSWKKTGGINRTSRHNLVRIPKAIEGSLKIYENTNSSNITIDGNSKLQISQGYDISDKWGTEYGAVKIGEDVSSNIINPHMLLYMATDPIKKNDYAYFMSESADGNTDRGNLTLVVADNSGSQNDKFIIRGYDEGYKKNTDIAYFSSQNGAVFNKVGIGLSAPRSEAILDISGIAYGTDPVDNTTDISYNSQLTTIGWVNNYVNTIAAGNALWQSLDNSYDIYENVGNLALLLDGHTTAFVDDIYAAVGNPNDVPKLYVDGTAFVTQNVGMLRKLSVGYDQWYVPSNALDIYGNIMCTDGQLIFNADIHTAGPNKIDLYNSQYGFGIDGNTLKYLSYENHKFYSGSSGINDGNLAMNIDAFGSVVCYGGASFIGVNTDLNTSTDSGVHLSNYFWTDSNDGSDNTAGNIQIVADNAYGGWIDFVDNSSGLSSDYQGRIRYGTTNGMTFFTNSLERLRIDPNGNVGIGTTTPSEKLEVKNGNIFCRDKVGIGTNPQEKLDIYVSEADSAWNTYDSNYEISTDDGGLGGDVPNGQSQNGICFFSTVQSSIPPTGIPSSNDYNDANPPPLQQADETNYNATIVNYNRFTPCIRYNGSLDGGIRSMYTGLLSSDDGGGTLAYASWSTSLDGSTQYGSYNAIGWATSSGGSPNPDIVMVLGSGGDLRLNQTAYIKLGVAIGIDYGNCVKYNDDAYLNAGIGLDAIKIPENGLIVQGNVGIGNTDPVSKLYVGMGLNGTMTLTDPNAVTIIHPTKASASNINDPKDMLYLGRNGTGGITYGSLAIFKLCKYQQDGTEGNYNVSSHARLDIAVSDVTADSSSPTVMSLRGDGHVGIGTDDPNEALDVSGNIVVNNGKTGQNQGGQLIFDQTYDEPGPNKINLHSGSYGFGVDGSTLKYLSWSAHKFYTNNTYDGNNGTLIMTIDNGGNVEATSYTATSDARHKENICDLDQALEKICSIRGVNFNFKDDDENNKHAGILAQEVHEIIPEAIYKKDDDKWAANYNTFIGYLIESVKTLKSEIDEYKKEKGEQQSRIESLESKMEAQGRLIQQLMDKMN